MTQLAARYDSRIERAARVRSYIVARRAIRRMLNKRESENAVSSSHEIAKTGATHLQTKKMPLNGARLLISFLFVFNREGILITEARLN